MAKWEIFRENREKVFTDFCKAMSKFRRATGFVYLCKRSTFLNSLYKTFKKKLKEWIKNERD